MTPTIDSLRAKLKEAILSRNTIERDAIRVVIAEAERGNIDAVKAVKKVLEANLEVLRVARHLEEERVKRLNEENSVLKALLPKMLSQEEIEAALLNSDGNEFEQIRDAKAVGLAMGIAMKFCQKGKLMVESADVSAVVKKIRDS